MSKTIKLSSPATREFWEIPVLFEDEHLLALDKPAGLLATADSDDLARPNLISLIHDAIAAGKPWTRERGLTYLIHCHRLDPETSGVFLLAKSKTVMAAVTNLLNSETPARTFLALTQGSPTSEHFTIVAKLAPHPTKPGLTHVDQNRGKKSQTTFEVLELFTSYALLKCQPTPDRRHQVRAHLRHAGLPVVGDKLYGGRPLLLSRLKPNYRLKPGHKERPLISQPAVHAESLVLPHPVTGQPITIIAPWPKNIAVAVKFLRRFAK